MSRRERLRIADGDERQVTRQRRGRLISCPNCMRTFETMRRFQLQCPQCGHTWEERSNRNLIDWLREQPANLVGGFIWVVPIVCLLAFIGWIIAALVINTGRQNFWYTLEIGTIVLALFGAFVLIGRSRH